MKIIRYQDTQNHTRFASLEPDGSAFEIEGDLFETYHVTKQQADVKKILAPIVPSMIWCIGLNYRQHAIETNADIPQYPIVFAKGPNTLQHPGDPIEIPTHLPSHEVDYECELVVVIGKVCKNVQRHNALDYVLGYTCGNDVSARDWQIKHGGSQWCRGKTFDTFSPMGPCLVTTDQIKDPNKLKIRTLLNGQVMQDWQTNDMIFDVPSLIEFLSGSTTLLPGTVIFTGTPHGVGMAQKPPRWLKPKDHVIIEIQGIGKLENPIIAE